MKDFEEVIGRIQTSIPNFTANYRCFDCLNKGGLPTEEDIQTKKKERVKKRSVDIFKSLCRVILHLEKMRGKVSTPVPSFTLVACSLSPS
jgi:hypothetical protein